MKAKEILRKRLHERGIIVYVLLIPLMLFFSDVFAQTLICGTDAITTNPTPVSITGKKVASCSDYNAYIPNASTRAKTVKINLHIIQKSDGSGNFQQGDAAHTLYLQKMIEGVNIMYENLADPTFGGVPTGQPANPRDTKIEFQLNPTIFYHQDDIGWDRLRSPISEILAVNTSTKTFTIKGNFVSAFNTIISNNYTIKVIGSTGDDGTYNVASITINGNNTNVTVSQIIPSNIADGKIDFSNPKYNDNGTMCGSYNYDNYGINKDKELNIFICGASNKGLGGCGPFNYVVVLDLYYDYISYPPGSTGSPYGGKPWLINPILAHEIGHCLGLNHTFNPDLFTDTPSEFSFCNSTNPCSNNIMAYNVQGKDYLSPMQIGYMHMRLAHDGFHSEKLAQCDYIASNFQSVTGTVIWNTSQVIGGDLIVENGAILTVQCNVSMPTGATVFVRPGGTLIVDDGSFSNLCGGDNPDFHLDAYSQMIVDNNTFFSLKNKVTLEVHEFAKLTVRNNSALIIENNADLAVHLDGLVTIEAGSELIIKNTTAGKGLCIGCNSSFYDTGELRIFGKLTTDNNVNLTNNGDGFISIHNNGVINLGTNSKIDLKGEGSHDLLLRFTTNANFTTGGHSFNITQGKVECISNSNISISSGDLFHIAPLSAVVVDNTSNITISQNATIELHEWSDISVKTGSKLIIENNALLTTHFSSLVHIQAGGELILKNTTAGKGLCIDCNSWFDDTAELRVEETLTTAAGVDLKNTGDGFFSFYDSGALNLGSGSNVVLNGKSKTEIFMQHSFAILRRRIIFTWSKHVCFSQLPCEI